MSGQDWPVGSMGKRRGRRTRSDEGKLRVDPQRGWALRNSPLTPEGRIELVGRFSRGLSRNPRLKRRAGLVFLAALVGVVVVSVVFWLVMLAMR